MQPVPDVREAGEARELVAVVGELAVDLVRDDVEVVLLRQLGRSLQLLLGVDGARRVAGVREPEGPRSGRDELLDHLHGGQVEALLGPRGDGDDLRQRGVGEGVVVRVEGLRQQYLVAGVADGLHGEGEGFAAAVGDVDVVPVVRDVPGVVVGADGVAQLVAPLRGGVGDGVHLEAADGVKIPLGRLDVRLADVEVKDLLALGLRLVGVGDEAANGGCGQRFDSFGKTHDDDLLNVLNESMNDVVLGGQDRGFGLRASSALWDHFALPWFATAAWAVAMASASPR